MNNRKVRDITLLLMFLSGWEEEKNNCDGKTIKCWNGYLFEVLDDLEEERLIRRYPTILQLTDEGISKACQINRGYLKLRR